MSKEFWKGKKVLITGHTGFKGSWLSMWLHQLGAEVHGFSLMPVESDSLFKLLVLEKLIGHHTGDITNDSDLENCITRVRPEVVFHLAAQALVLHSYDEPMKTWETNVIGTIKIMEALRKNELPCSFVCITTDKVYENKEWLHPYREVDRLGGYDPYSSSKAAVEIAVDSWRNSFSSNPPFLKLATARAGNVIGGGDWAENRIIPDIIRALSAERPITVRNPFSVRPWQHVLEPLSGYIRLGECLLESDDPCYQGAFNFGPTSESFRTVEELVEEAIKHWPGTWEKKGHQPKHLHEASKLSLCIAKSKTLLKWSPHWTFSESVQQTVEWYKGHKEQRDPVCLTLEQIIAYQEP